MNMYDIGMVGLAVMGRSLALNLADHGFRVAGYNRSRAVTDEMTAHWPHENFAPFYQLEELIDALQKPRRILLMVKAGEAVDAVLRQLVPLLEPGDIVMDGGNSFFEDTRRREAALREKGLLYFGVGVSGGEAGARRGPSLMPGGDRAAYEAYVRPLLEAIAAKAADGTPCCAYMGPDGAGHYVKMVHNGIEYADMQLISEAYLLLKHVGGLDNQEMARYFAEWNRGELKSYLMEITADILREPDDLTPGELLDRIEDSAAQKGTGRWTSIEALRQGADVSLITAAGAARVMSNRLEQRTHAATLFPAPPMKQAQDTAAFAETVHRGLYAAKLTAYAQGFALLRTASEAYGWGLDLGAIAAIFRAGCIIQAVFLDDITAAFRRNPDLESLVLDPHFLSEVTARIPDLRAAAGAGLQSGVPVPALSAATVWLDQFRGAPMGANLIQAQRDCFGAHTYHRTDRDGVFHHEWGAQQ